MFGNLYELMGMMTILIILGFILRKKEIITAAGKKSLTDLILYVVLPCNIIKAFSMKMEEGMFLKFARLLVIAILVQVIALIIARCMYNRQPVNQKQVFQYATVCSNSGFMGNPLAEGVFGNTGLLYASIFLIPQRIVMWTAGVSYFQKGTNKKEVYKKVLRHPCMVATYIGLFIMAFQIPLLGPINATVKSLSNCCTALTMVYIGTILIDVDFKTMIDGKQIYFAIIRLFLIPITIFAVCRIARVDSLITGVCTLLSATPAGSTTSLLASKYEADEVAAAKCVVFTTAISCLTIPIWSAILLEMM